MENAALALTAVHALRSVGLSVEERAVRMGLANAQWPGRFDIRPGTPTVVLDGAHNAEGAASFRKALAQYFPDKPAALILGMLKTKDSQPIIDQIEDAARIFVCTEPDHPDALPAETLALQLRRRGRRADVRPHIGEAFDCAKKEAGADGVMAVVGSLYLVAQVMKELGDGHDRL